MWLVDSSTFIDWMRAGRNPTRILRPYVLTGQLVSCGVIRVEVLRGAIKPAVKAELGALFDAIQDIPFSASIWTRTVEWAWRLDRQGTVLPVSDLMIAGCAQQVGATVVTADPHFAAIPGLRVRRELPAADAFDASLVEP
jgi:predicted nucleic acid-binding protein